MKKVFILIIHRKVNIIPNLYQNSSPDYLVGLKNSDDQEGYLDIRLTKHFGEASIFSDLSEAKKVAVNLLSLTDEVLGIKIEEIFIKSFDKTIQKPLLKSKSKKG